MPLLGKRLVGRSSEKTPGLHHSAAAPHWTVYSGGGDRDSLQAKLTGGVYAGIMPGVSRVAGAQKIELKALNCTKVSSLAGDPQAGTRGT